MTAEVRCRSYGRQPCRRCAAAAGAPTALRHVPRWALPHFVWAAFALDLKAVSNRVAVAYNAFDSAMPEGRNAAASVMARHRRQAVVAAANGGGAGGKAGWPSRACNTAGAHGRVQGGRTAWKRQHCYIQHATWQWSGGHGCFLRHGGSATDMPDSRSIGRAAAPGGRQYQQAAAGRGGSRGDARRRPLGWASSIPGMPEVQKKPKLPQPAARSTILQARKLCAF